MTYHGTVVLTRADVVLSRLPGIETLGFRHQRLRELGGGWQVLETSGVIDPPDLERAATDTAAAWHTPVLAAYVADACAQIHGAVPVAAAWSGHLADPADTDCGMRHCPRTRPGGTFEALEAHLSGWARDAGRPLSLARLGRALRHRLEHLGDPGPPYLDQCDQLFELVRALGFPVIPAPRDYAFDPDEAPFAAVTGPMWGLAALAHRAAIYRAHDAGADPPAAWELEAITLEADLYAALYGGGHPVADLAARARAVLTDYRAAYRARNPYDLDLHMVDDPLPAPRSDGVPAPNGTYLADSTAGPGLWPDLS